MSCYRSSVVSVLIWRRLYLKQKLQKSHRIKVGISASEFLVSMLDDEAGHAMGIWQNLFFHKVNGISHRFG